MEATQCNSVCCSECPELAGLRTSLTDPELPFALAESRRLAILNTAPSSGPVERGIGRCALAGGPIHSVYVLPTADGITTPSPNLTTRAWVARQPVQWPGAMTWRLKEARSRTVSGIIFSFAADR